MNLYGLLDAIINKVNRAVKVEKQELDSSLQKQARENINVPSKNEICNPNLLDNWYFGNPVNQRGRTEYTGNIYNIDRWKGNSNALTVKIEDGFISLNSAGSPLFFEQKIKKPLKAGQKYTISILAKGSGVLRAQTGNSTHGVKTFATESWDLISSTFNPMSDFDIFMIRLGNNEQCDIIAAKLELGDTQTLAHQDSNGNWVLNEIPNYAKELLVCRQYDPYTGEYIGLRKFSQPQNLLDNSDFRNPVNQRGQSSYTTNGYTIDRWFTPSGATITIGDGGVTVAAYHFVQRVESKAFKHNGLVTFALKLSDRLCIGTANLFGVSVGTVGYFYEDDAAILQFYRESESIWQVIVIAKVPITMEWAALYEGEYTADMLPEYQPKGYAAELLICRQYDLDTGEYIGLRKFSQPRNLLDNSDFRNPVNQRRNASYSGNKYTIDRWYMWNSSANGSLTMEDGYITTTAALYQYLEKVKENTVYTLAVKYLGEEPYVISHTFEDGINNIPTNFYIDSKNSIRLGPGNIEWAALYEGEYTADTLPEYTSKGYVAELAECQRYYYRFGTRGTYVLPFGYGRSSSATEAKVLIPLPVMMRDIPTLTAESNIEFVITSEGMGTTLSSSPIPFELNVSGLIVDIISSGMTSPRPVILTFRSTTTTGKYYIELSADL